MSQQAAVPVFWEHICKAFQDKLCLDSANDSNRSANCRRGEERATFCVISPVSREDLLAEIRKFYKPLGYEVCLDRGGAMLKKGGKAVAMVITLNLDPRLLTIFAEPVG